MGKNTKQMEKKNCWGLTSFFELSRAKESLDKKINTVSLPLSLALFYQKHYHVL